jgi:hypothetical protein
VPAAVDDPGTPPPPRLLLMMCLAETLNIQRRKVQWGLNLRFCQGEGLIPVVDSFVAIASTASGARLEREEEST